MSERKIVQKDSERVRERESERDTERESEILKNGDLRVNRQ